MYARKSLTWLGWCYWNLAWVIHGWNIKIIFLTWHHTVFKMCRLFVIIECYPLLLLYFNIMRFPYLVWHADFLSVSSRFCTDIKLFANTNAFPYFSLHSVTSCSVTCNWFGVWGSYEFHLPCKFWRPVYFEILTVVWRNLRRRNVELMRRLRAVCLLGVMLFGKQTCYNCLLLVQSPGDSPNLRKTAVSRRSGTPLKQVLH